ncbi:MAG: ABC transporter ATP-binding protein [Desulfurococcales archaeon]|nr:ABC transporter ATP-binding protein [Desulfurococcales archaeon]
MVEMAAAMLELRSVTSGYGKMEVLHGVNLTVKEGEIVSVLGPNGAGKTTMLNTVFGIATLHSGKILFKGERIDGLKPHTIVRLGIGYSPQLDNVFPNLTVEDNLLMGAYMRGRDPEIRDDIKEMYDLFPEIARRRNQKAKTLSGGERQMLAVARALMSRPKLLLLDEPTSGLAPKAASTLMNKVMEIRERGITILIVEQNVKKALSVSDRAYVLVSGRIVKEAPAEELAKVELDKLFFSARAEAE